MNSNDIYFKETILVKITQAAQTYDKTLNNKNILILFKQNNTVNFVTLQFKPENFHHFTGTKIDRMSKEMFFYNAKNNRLSISDFTVNNTLVVSKKMDVIIDGMNLPFNATSLGQFAGEKIQLKADLGAGNILYTMTFGEFSKTSCYPKGILKGDVRNNTNPTSPIIAILSKGLKDEIYDTITYKSKNINIDKLHFPKNITSLLTPEALYALKPSLQTKNTDKTQVYELGENATNIEDTSADVPKENPKGIFNRIRNMTFKKNSRTEHPKEKDTHSKIIVNDNAPENIAKDERTVKHRLTLEERLAQASKKADELNNKSQPQNIKAKNNNINLD